MKKIASTLLAASMAFAMLAASASAAEPAEAGPEATQITYQDICPEASCAVEAALISPIDSCACFIPYNDGSGTSGQIAATFTAESSTFNFILYSLGGGETYHAALWQDNGAGSPATLVDVYYDYSFGSGFSQPGLTVGQDYYIVISSMNVPACGANGCCQLWF